MAREKFGSRFGAIMALAGSAVGLGNIWKFPYEAGSNGGGAFLLVYLFFVFVIGIPVMLSEFVIGRRGQRNPFGSFKTQPSFCRTTARWLAGLSSMWRMPSTILSTAVRPTISANFSAILSATHTSHCFGK
jgi:SNF family Na+-dependent transporter